MGYEVHVTRRTPWWAEEGEEITAQEWAAVVAADPDLEMTGVARSPVQGQDVVLEFRSAGLAQMITHPQRDTHGCWLHLRLGMIIVKHPDDVLLGKMREIASLLGARVQDDDGHYFDE